MTSKQSAGGKARAAKLSPEDRKRIAAEAANQRWSAPGKQLVYVIGPDVGPQKIGIALRPALRVREIQTGNPAALRVALEFDPEECAALQVERRAHWLLHEVRLNGEWFDATPEQAIAAVRQALIDVRNGRLAPTKEPSTTLRSIRLSVEKWEWLDAEARTRGVSVNALVIEAINAYMAAPFNDLPPPRRSPPRRPAPTAEVRLTMPRAPYGSRLKKVK